jgi:hypothetical protein
MYYVTEGYTSKSNFESFTCREFSRLAEKLSDSQEFFPGKPNPYSIFLALPQVSAAVCMRASFSWDVRQLRFVFSDLNFGTTYWSIFLGCLTPECGTDILSQNVGT